MPQGTRPAPKQERDWDFYRQRDAVEDNEDLEAGLRAQAERVRQQQAAQAETADYKRQIERDLADPDSPWRANPYFQQVAASSTNIFGNIAGSAVRGASAIAGAVGADETAESLDRRADSINRYGNAFRQVATEAQDETIVPNWMERAAGGAYESLGTMSAAGPGGFPAIVGTFGAQAYNQGLTEARDAGLPEDQAQAYARNQAINEVVVTSAFQAVAPGLEGMFTGSGRAAAAEAYKSGIKAAIGEFAKRTTGELSEELTIELIGAAIEADSGVNPDAMSLEQLKARGLETAATTLMTMGMAEIMTYPIRKQQERFKAELDAMLSPDEQAAADQNFMGSFADQPAAQPITPDSPPEARTDATLQLSDQERQVIIDDALDQENDEQDAETIIESLGYFPELMEDQIEESRKRRASQPATEPTDQAETTGPTVAPFNEIDGDSTGEAQEIQATPIAPELETQPEPTDTPEPDSLPGPSEQEPPVSEPELPGGSAPETQGPMSLPEADVEQSTGETQDQPPADSVDISHLDALELRLSNERMRLDAAKSDKERESRQFIVDQIEREIAGEKKFLGIDGSNASQDGMTDDQLLNELLGDQQAPSTESPTPPNDSQTELPVAGETQTPKKQIGAKKKPKPEVEPVSEQDKIDEVRARSAVPEEEVIAKTQENVEELSKTLNKPIHVARVKGTGEIVAVDDAQKSDERIEVISSHGPGYSGETQSTETPKKEIGGKKQPVPELPKERPAVEPAPATEETKRTPRTMDSYAPAEIEALKRIDRSSQAYFNEAAKTEGGRGLAVGAGNIDSLWKGEGQRRITRLVQQGYTIDEAVEVAKKEAREAIERHNKRRPNDINWGRWEGSADTAIDTAASILRNAQKSDAATAPPQAELPKDKPVSVDSAPPKKRVGAKKVAEPVDFTPILQAGKPWVDAQEAVFDLWRADKIDEVEMDRLLEQIPKTDEWNLAKKIPGTLGYVYSYSTNRNIVGRVGKPIVKDGRAINQFETTDGKTIEVDPASVSDLPRKIAKLLRQGEKLTMDNESVAFFVNDVVDKRMADTETNFSQLLASYGITESKDRMNMRRLIMPVLDARTKAEEAKKREPSPARKAAQEKRVETDKKSLGKKKPTPPKPTSIIGLAASVNPDFATGAMVSVEQLRDASPLTKPELDSQLLKASADGLIALSPSDRAKLMTPEQRAKETVQDDGNPDRFFNGVSIRKQAKDAPKKKAGAKKPKSASDSTAYMAQPALQTPPTPVPTVEQSRAAIERIRPTRAEEGDQVGVSAQRIIKMWSRLFNVPIRVGRTPTIPAKYGKIMGIYQGLSPKHTVSRTLRLQNQHAVDLLVAAHEIGHHIDRQTSIATKSPTNKKIGIPKHLHGEVSAMDYEPKGRLNEGWAEYLRIYITEPSIKDDTGVWLTGPQAYAPEFTKWFEGTWMKDHPKIAQQISRARTHARQFNEQSLFELARTMIGTQPGDDLSFKERTKRRFHRSLRGFQERAYDIYIKANDVDEMARANGYRGIRLRDALTRYEHSAGPEGMAALEDGVHDIRTGAKISNKGFWSRITENLVNDVEMDEAAEYALARHTLFMEKMNPQYRGPMTPDQARKYVAEIAKNPEQQKRYENVAIAISDFAHELLEMRVRAGSISRESADRMVNSYGKNYFPMMRVVGPDGVAMASRSSRSILNQQFGAKKRSKSGSDLPVQNPYESMQRMAVQYYALAAKARLNEILHQMVDSTEGMGWFGSKVPPKMKVTKVAVAEVLDDLVKSGFVEEDTAKASQIALDIRDGEEITDDDQNWFDSRHGLVDPTEEDRVRAAMTEPDPNHIIELWRADYSGDPGKRIAVRYDRNGNPQLYEYDSEFYEMITGLTGPQAGLAIHLVKKASRGFKLATVGANFTFAVKNLIRDFVSYQGRARYARGTQSVTGPVKNFAGAIAAKAQRATGKTDKINSVHLLYDELAGSTMSEVGTSDSALRRRARQRLGKSFAARAGVEKGERFIGTGKAVLSTFRRGADLIEGIVAITDMPPRLTEMEAAIREEGFIPMQGGKWKDTTSGNIVSGLPEAVRIKAMVAAAEATVNFRKRGSVSTNIDAFAPFFQATINAKSKFAKLGWNAGKHLANPFGKSGLMADNNDARQARRFLIYHASIASASILYALARGDDDDYLEQPKHVKDNFWTFGWDGRTRVTIPKVQDERNLFGIIEDSLSNLPDDQRRTLADFARAELGEWGPSFGGPLRGAGEVLADYDFFKDRELTPTFMKNRPKNYQFKDSTATLSILAAKALNDTAGETLSPIQIEHLVDAATGGMYGRVFRTAKGVAGGNAGLDSIPGVRALVEDRHYSQSVSDLYDRIEEINREGFAAKEEGDEEKVIELDRQKKQLGSYKDLVSAIQKVGYDTGTDPYRFTPQLVGLAREALGREPYETSPSPFSVDDPPEELVPALETFATKRVRSAVLLYGRPQQDHSDGTTLEEATADWEAQRQADIEWLQKNRGSAIVKKAIQEAIRTPRFKEMTKPARRRVGGSIKAYQNAVRDRVDALTAAGSLLSDDD